VGISTGRKTLDFRVFLSYAREDREKVERLYQKLSGAGFKPWMDTKDILPGEIWKSSIQKAIRSSDFFLACLSANSVSKRGFLQREIKDALDVWQEMLGSDIYLIPVRLDDCDVPESLRDFQWVNLFEEDGWTRLVKAIQGGIERREDIPPPEPAFLLRQPFEPEMVLITAGEFLMGSDPGKDKLAEDDEQPQHTLHLPDYYLAKTPVTNARYATFVQATDHHQPIHWEGGKPPKDKENHPVVYVSWHDAVAYCEWLSKVTGKLYRLPSEAEWEKGARGGDGRIYPWGNRWDAQRCNSSGGQFGTTLVGAYPQGASPYGLLDMAGNVWEWTRSVYAGYPYDPEDGREDLLVEGLRTLRGGSWSSNPRRVRTSCRDSIYPRNFRNDIGIRVVLVPV
jgi:formylglycine-generating enzyme required for sulfatase activity